MKTRITSSIICLALILSLVSCEKEKIFPFINDTTHELYTIMDDYYYWIDSIPNVNYENYSSPSDLLEAMRFSSKDKWSYITTKQEDQQYYVEGKYVGYGFGYAPDNENKIRLTYLYEDCDFNNDGVERGWIINKINGVNIDSTSSISSMLGDDEIGVSNSFEFESPSGTAVSKSYSKKEIEINTVVYSNIIIEGAKKVGYLVFNNFIEPSIDELSEVFANFKSEGVNELVIDLRYNGGGRLDVVTHLAGLIIPSNLNNQKFLAYKHNNTVSDLDKNINFTYNSNSLNLSKVYFIAGQGSASASEAIINGLEPYLDVYIVGDNTYGKPVGMYSFNSRISNLVYVPISFSLINKDGYGNYFNGLNANSYVSDDVYHNFGSGEAVFDEVLNHITTGSFSSTKSAFEIRKGPKKEIRSIKEERGSL